MFEREPAKELIRSLLDDNNPAQEAASIRAVLLECGVPYDGELSDEQVFLVLTLAAARWPSQLREAIREGLEDPPQTLVGVAADHLMLPIFSSGDSPDAEIFLFDAPFFRMYLLPTAYYRPSEPEAAHLYFFGRGFRDGQYGHLGHVAIRRNNDATRLVDVATYLLSDMLTGFGKEF